MKGYGGVVLNVDLSSGTISRKPTDPEVARKFIGGWGLNTWLAYQLIGPEMPPLAPETPIILGAGVLCGTPAPMSCKSFYTHKCPSTGSVSTGVGSLSFGPMLKWAGYDHIVITGKAPRPVYLRISDDEAAVCDASHLWGRDVNEAHDALREEYGEECSTVCIGQAGENLVKIALALIDKNSTFGRTVGCNFGSKNLKAIVVKGTKGQEVAHTRRFMTAVDAARARGMADPNRDGWIRGGLFYPLHGNLLAAARARHQATEALPLRTEEVYPIDLWDKGCKVRIACPSCLIPDKGVWVMREGEYQGLEVPMSTPAWALDSIKYDIEDLGQSLKRWDLSNRWGIDGTAFGRLFDFAVGLYQMGLITKEDTGGTELKFGYETFIKLTEMTVKREGFGDLLAEGFNGFIKKIGRGCEKYAIQVKGQDMDQDPRGSLGFETFGAAVNFRPASDMPVGGHTMAGGRPASYFQHQSGGWGVPEEARKRIFADPDSFDIGYLQPHYESWATVLNCLGLCFRLQSSRLYPVSLCAELYSAATGIETSPAELLKEAERSWNIGKASNVKEGFSRKDDWWPDAFFDIPLKFEGKELPLMDYFKKKRVAREDFGRLLDHYYEERGWDVATGIPTAAKLAELDLPDVAEDLKKLDLIS